jgi:hypothetical protein
MFKPTNISIGDQSIAFNGSFDFSVIENVNGGGVNESSILEFN